MEVEEEQQQAARRVGGVQQRLEMRKSFSLQSLVKISSPQGRWLVVVVME